MRRTIWIVLLLAVFGGLVAWRLVTKNRQAQALQQQRAARARAPVQVAVAEAEVRDISSTYSTTGTLQPSLDVKIAPKVTGRVVYIRGEEGDRVRSGEVLVRLDSEEVEADVRQQQANLREAQWRLAQAQTTTGVTDTQVSTQIGQQVAAVSSARTNYDQLRSSAAAQIATGEAAVRQAQGQVNSAVAAVASARADLGSAGASRDNATIHYNRLYQLYSQGFVAAQDVDDAKAAVRVQEAAVLAARGRLENAVGAQASAEAQRASAREQLTVTRTRTGADVETARQNLLQAEESLRLARANRAQSPAYRQGLAALQATVQSARGSLAAAVARRGDTVLLAPMDGFVTQRAVDPGTTVGAGQTLLGLQAFGDIWVTFAVPAEISEVMRPGQQVDAAFDVFPQTVFPARVLQINPSAPADGRQFTIRATLSNPRRLLKPGMFAKVVLTTAHVRAVAVPPEAVRSDAEGSFVTVVAADSTAHRRAVAPGLSDGNYVAVPANVGAGEQVVVRGGERLREGARVAASPIAGGGSGRAGGYASATTGGGAVTRVR